MLELEIQHRTLRFLGCGSDEYHQQHVDIWILLLFFVHID